MNPWPVASSRSGTPLFARLLPLLVLLVGPAVLPAGEPKPAEPPERKRWEVTVERDLTYYPLADDPDAYRHQLDVYRPVGKGPFPVLFFVHGGAWVAMSKDDVLGLHGYGTIARCLAERGLVVVLPNYRLSPAVKHPEHIKDVARAFAWTCRNVHKYGGDPNHLVVGGHSAGGHLATLLVTDETYLRQVGRSRKDIRGVIGISGVYRVDDLDMKLEADAPGGEPGKVKVRPLALVFGDDPQVLRQASPVTHVGPGIPPVLLISAGYDYPGLPRMAQELVAELRKNGCAAEWKLYRGRTHETLVFDLLNLTADRVTVDTIAAFVFGLPRPAAAEGARGKGE